MSEVKSDNTMDSFNATLVPEDDSRAHSKVSEVEGTQPLSSNLVHSESQREHSEFRKENKENNAVISRKPDKNEQNKAVTKNYICTLCRDTFETENEMDLHTDSNHSSLANDDKIALKLTSGLSAMLDAVLESDPNIMEIKYEESQPNVETKEPKIEEPTIKEEKTFNETMSCKECDFKADSKRDIRMHMKHSHDSNEISCTKCKMKLQTKEALKQHMQKRHMKEIKCDDCEYKTTSTNMMMLHIKKKHTKATVFRCNECLEEFKTRMTFVNHKRNHNAPFKCEMCNFKGVSHKALKAHNTKEHIQKDMERRGTKREFSLPKVPKTSVEKSPPNKIMKNAKQQKETQPKKEGPTDAKEVIGGPGWSFKSRAENKLQLDEIPTNKPTEILQSEEPNLEDLLPGDLVPLPPQVLRACPDHTNSLMHCVLGDGSCCLRCVAVHLDLGENFGADSSRQLNKHIYKYKKVYRNKISFPKNVRIGGSGRKETFKDTPEEVDRYFKFINSEEATYLWREGSDMCAIANYYNMTIEVIKLDNKTGKVVVRTEYGPDEDFQWEETDKPAEPKPKMTVLNAHDHFNLIVTENSQLLKAKKVNAEAKTYKCSGCEKSAETEADINIHEEQVHPVHILRELKIENMNLRNIINKQKSFDSQQPQSHHPTLQPLAPHPGPPHPGPLQSEAPPLAYTSYNLFQGPLATQPNPPPKLPSLEGASHKHNKEQQRNQTKQLTKFSDLWNCHLCGNGFSTSQLLEAHMRNKHGQQKGTEASSQFRFSRFSNCDICEEVFSTPQLLKEHMQNTHNQDEEMPGIDEHSKESGERDMDTEDKDKRGKFKCKVCNLVQNTKSKLEVHMKNHIEDADWICNGDSSKEDCPFQANEKALLENHVKESGHTAEMLEIKELDESQKTKNQSQIQKISPNNQSMLKCPFCNELFNSKNTLARHRKDVHPTHKPCRNILNCEFQTECFYSHSPIPDGMMRCYECGEDWNNMNDLMNHRKSAHVGVKPCKKFLSNECRRGEQCWWSHDQRSTQPHVDFPNLSANWAPPDPAWSQLNPPGMKQPNPNQEIIQTMTSLMNQMKRIIQNLSQ